MHFHQIYDAGLAQYAYLIGCEATGKALLVDPERDVDRYLRLADDKGLSIEAVVETHIHADFLSGARELAWRAGLKIYLSALGESEGWGYDWPRHSNADFEFLKDGDGFSIGELEMFVRHTPGHTPEHITLLVREPGAPQPIGALTGDFLFVGARSAGPTCWRSPPTSPTRCGLRPRRSMPRPPCSSTRPTGF
jgi:hydroxyacylglutathione hydrolase